MRTRRAVEHVEKKTLMAKPQATVASKETMKQLKDSALLVGVEQHPANRSPTPVEATEEQPRKEPQSPVLHYNKRKKKGVVDTQIRKSQRLQNAVMPVQDNEVDRLHSGVIISLMEDEVEDADNGQEKLLQSTSSPKTLEEKVECIAEQLEAQEKLLKELRNSNSLPTGTSSAGSARYKKLYFESQKQTEALMDLNKTLAANLGFARGKIEGYETAAGAFSSALEKLKDVIVASTVGAAHLSNNTLRDALASVDSGAEGGKGAGKRKKDTTNRT